MYLPPQVASDRAREQWAEEVRQAKAKGKKPSLWLLMVHLEGGLFAYSAFLWLLNTLFKADPPHPCIQ